MLMGIATFLVALVPTYERIGIWGAVLLTILRLVQSVGVGGEWGRGLPQFTATYATSPRRDREAE
jgi:MFS family permease